MGLTCRPSGGAVAQSKMLFLRFSAAFFDIFPLEICSDSGTVRKVSVQAFQRRQPLAFRGSARGLIVVQSFAVFRSLRAECWGQRIETGAVRRVQLVPSDVSKNIFDFFSSVPKTFKKPRFRGFRRNSEHREKRELRTCQKKVTVTIETLLLKLCIYLERLLSYGDFNFNKQT